MLVGHQIGPVEPAFLDEMKLRFPPIEVHEDTTLNAVMMDAGRQEMIKYLERHTVIKTVSGEI